MYSSWSVRTPSQEEDRHQAFTRAMTFHLKKPRLSKTVACLNSLACNLDVGNKARKFLVLDMAIFCLHSPSSSLAAQLGREKIKA